MRARAMLRSAVASWYACFRHERANEDGYAISVAAQWEDAGVTKFAEVRIHDMETQSWRRCVLQRSQVAKAMLRGVTSAAVYTPRWLAQATNNKSARSSPDCCSFLQDITRQAAGGHQMVVRSAARESSKKKAARRVVALRTTPVLKIFPPPSVHTPALPPCVRYRQYAHQA